MRYALERGADLVGLEDDIACSRNAVALMLGYPVPDDVGFVSFFDNLTAPGAPAGLQRYEAAGPVPFWGAQAVKIPARTLPVLRDEVGVFMQPRPPHGRTHCRDLALQDCLVRSPWPRWATLFPHVVQHVGDVSAVQGPRYQRLLATGGRRESMNYAGDDFDAMTLMP